MNDLKYEETQSYWNDVFGQVPDYDIHEKINIEEIEKAMDWLVKSSNSIIDFGCGNGRILLRCLDKGVKNAYGVDLSESAINKGNSILKNNKLVDRAKLECGSFELIDKIKDNSFNGAILFNIIDNLQPEDSLNLIRNIYRILAPGGKVLLKLNQFIEKEQIIQYGFEKISEDFYKEDTGLFLWNLNKEKISKILEPYFNIEKGEDIYFKQYDMTNRMYYLSVKK